MRRLFYFTRSERLLENLLAEHLKVSSFSKCNDFFELASVNLAEKDVRSKQRKWASAIEPQLGLVCFSKGWRHPLMWAHYANSGTGACLVVDVDQENLQDVNYIQERQSSAPKFEFPSETAKEFRVFCATKARYWAYEMEVRLFVARSHRDFVEKNGIGFLKLGNAVRLVGVINGPRPHLGASVIRKAARDINFFQCRPANTRFEMVSNQLVGTWNQ
jgi:hypothetical protein